MGNITMYLDCASGSSILMYMNASDFLTHYAVAALWTSTIEEDMATVLEMPADTHLDSAGFAVSDIDAGCLDIMRSDCEDFLMAAGEILERTGMSAEQAGHDFWLTRNGHGAGFWDRGLGADGDLLSDIARGYGESYLYLAYTGDTLGHLEVFVS